MKPFEEVKREFVKRWLNKARQDMELVEYLVSQGAGHFNAVAFHSQQAAEKYLKALLVYHQVEFPKTHNLGKLLDFLRGPDAPLAESLRGITVMNPYGVDVCYPDDAPEVTSDKAAEAAKLAATVRDAVLAAVPDDVRNP